MENKKLNPDDIKKLEQAQQAKQPERPPFRGVAIHMQVDGKFGLELQGVTIMEVFGVLTLAMEKMKEDLGGN